jgi:hypothetical protein
MEFALCNDFPAEFFRKEEKKWETPCQILDFSARTSYTFKKL